MTSITKEYGLIGYPLGHSFSQKHFNTKFQREEISARYLNFEIPQITLLPDLLTTHPLLRGFNVTIPHKQTILPFLDSLSDAAKAIGAVNVVDIRRTTTGIHLKGYNTDTIGFQKSLQPLLTPKDRHALVLGATGGAAQAVLHTLQQLHISATKVSRHRAPGVTTYEDLSAEDIKCHTIIINCTPLGTCPHTDTCPPIPYQHITSHHLLYDLVYNPSHTLFLQRGTAQGARIKNGFEMLQLQAEAAWRIWQSEKE